MNQTVRLIASGFVVGILSGLLGVGGGVFFIPIMVGFFAVAQHTAHGTSLAAVIPTALISSAIYGLHGNLDLPLTGMIVAGSMAGATVGARLAKKIPAHRLKQLFGVMLILTGLRMVFS